MDDDNRTCYSDARAPTYPAAQQSIVDVCRDIVDKLSHLPEESSPQLLQELPALVKAFALKLGFDSDHASGWEIMWFIYKHSR
jgi:hypothetical protein